MIENSTLRVSFSIILNDHIELWISNLHLWVFKMGGNKLTTSSRLERKRILQNKTYLLTQRILLHNSVYLHEDKESFYMITIYLQLV